VTAVAEALREIRDLADDLSRRVTAALATIDRPAPAWQAGARRDFEAGRAVKLIAADAGVDPTRIYQLVKAGGWQRPATAPAIPKAAALRRLEAKASGAAAQPGKTVPRRLPRPSPSSSRATAPDVNPFERASAPTKEQREKAARAERNDRFRTAWAAGESIAALQCAFGYRSRSGVIGLARYLRLPSRAIDQTGSAEEQRIARKHDRQTRKADRDARFRQLYEAGASISKLCAACDLTSERGVRRLATILGLPARGADMPVSKSEKPKRYWQFRARAEQVAAAQERFAVAASTSDVVAAAKLYLQRKGVVVYAAAVADNPDSAVRPQDGDVLKVDGRAMSLDEMVAKARTLGFRADAIVPLLRRPEVA
jgi:hypothetical protein